MVRARAAFVVPLYNHRNTVRQVVQAALGIGWPVVVVDDGSTDGGAHGLEELGDVVVIRHAANLGKGAALLSGLAALSSRVDYAVSLDADGQFDPHEASRLLGEVTGSERPLVLGSREGMGKATVPRGSRFGREFSNFWVRVSGGPRLRDSQTGFRAYPIAETLALGVRARRFEFEVEVLVRAHWSRTPVLEVPVTVVYPEKPERVSHFRLGLDSLRNAATFARLVLGRLFGRKRRPTLKPPAPETQ
jgi:glycosyltransferase involved in cell wall biosynthesis